MADDASDLTPQQAGAALGTVDSMKLAGWRRAVPPRWVYIGYAIVAGGSCATFAVEPLKNVYFYWWALAYIVLLGFSAKITNARQREFHPPRERRLSYWSSTIGMLIAGFGSIYLRYHLDAPWIAVAGGTINFLWMIAYYEVERAYTPRQADTESRA